MVKASASVRRWGMLLCHRQLEGDGDGDGGTNGSNVDDEDA